MQDLQGATDAYTAVLALSDAGPADKLAALSNRAACSLAQLNFQDAVDDCNSACAALTGHDAQPSADVQSWLKTNAEGVVHASVQL